MYKLKKSIQGLSIGSNRKKGYFSNDFLFKAAQMQPIDWF